jgi:hypothetical protein
VLPLDGVIQDPGGFGETAHGGWANPIVLGGGTQLFPQDGVSAMLQLAATRTLDSGVVSLTYVPT